MAYMCAFARYPFNVDYSKYQSLFSLLYLHVYIYLLGGFFPTYIVFPSYSKDKVFAVYLIGH